MAPASLPTPAQRKRFRGGSDGPPCPHCGATTSRVVSSRLPLTLNVYRRRRECTSCAKRFTSYEISDTRNR